jgi:hypothetical protein
MKIDFKLCFKSFQSNGEGGSAKKTLCCNHGQKYSVLGIQGELGQKRISSENQSVSDRDRIGHFLCILVEEKLMSETVKRY